MAPDKVKPGRDPFITREVCDTEPKGKEHTFASGAESSQKVRDYGLCPAEALAAIVDRYQYGIDKHGEKWRNNWQKGLNDHEFVKDRLNHAFEHFQAVLTGYHIRLERPASYEDIQAALCGLAMATWWYTHGEGLCNAFPHLTSPGPHRPLAELKQ